MAQEQKSPATRAALIGLIGTLLTVCSGAGGAIISAAVTIYRTERQAQQVDLTAPGSEQALRVDTGGIAVSREEAAALDPAEYYVDLDWGFAIHQPLPGWGELEKLTLLEAALEESQAATPEPPLSEQLLYRIRYGEPIEIQIDSKALVNGFPLSPAAIEANNQYYGPEPWTQTYHSQMVVYVLERSVEEGLGVSSLPDMLVTMRRYGGFGGHFNRLVAREGSGFIIVQSTNTWGNVRLAGETATVTQEFWSLLAEGEDAYYVVEITYMPQSGQSVQVWDDLQAYMTSFRVIR